MRYIKVLCNTVQLLGAKTKLIHVIHLKAFLFRLEFVIKIYAYISYIWYITFYKTIHFLIF